MNHGVLADRPSAAWRSLRNAACVAALAAIGGLFVLRYAARVVETPDAWAIGYVLVFALALWALLRGDVRHLNSAAGRKAAIVVLVLLVAGAVAAVFGTPAESRVDRLPAIEEWLSRLFSGAFPWSAEATRPSGLPVLFLVAAPMYLLGNAGLFVAVGLAAFALILVVRAQRPADLVLWTACLTLLPTTYYEVAVRSDLLVNMVLVVGAILIADRRLDAVRIDRWFIGAGVIFGLVLSTRVVVALPIAVYLAYRFRREVLNGVLFCGLVALTSGLTLLPFIVWDSAAFFAHGPFSVQMLYLPWAVAVGFIVLAVVSGYLSRDVDDALFASGAILFTVVAVAFGLAVRAEETGIRGVIVGEGFDVSYFIFAAPFLLLVLRRSKSSVC